MGRGRGSGHWSRPPARVRGISGTNVAAGAETPGDGASGRFVERSDMRPGRRADGARGAAIWTAAGILLLVFAPRVWSRGGPARLSLAETPIDRPSPEAAAQWVFLTESQKHLPPGASYTIRADEPDDEMNLFMMSLGVCQGHLPYPNSYFGIPIPGHAAHADFILDYRCGSDASDGRALVARVRGGCVERQTKTR